MSPDAPIMFIAIDGHQINLAAILAIEDLRVGRHRSAIHLSNGRTILARDTPDRVLEEIHSKANELLATVTAEEQDGPR